MRKFIELINQDKNKVYMNIYIYIYIKIYLSINHTIHVILLIPQLL